MKTLFKNRKQLQITQFKVKIIDLYFLFKKTLYNLLIVQLLKSLIKFNKKNHKHKELKDNIQYKILRQIEYFQVKIWSTKK